MSVLQSAEGKRPVDKQRLASEKLGHRRVKGDVITYKKVCHVCMVVRACVRACVWM